MSFVMMKVCLSQQTEKFCHGKPTFLMTKDVFCHDKHMFVMTKLLSRQKITLVAAPANDNVKLPPFFPLFSLLLKATIAV